MTNQIQVVPRPQVNQVMHASDTLFRIKAVFPFDLFPNEIIVDRFKIDVIKKTFFATESVYTIPMTGSVSVTVNRSIIFASVGISDPASNKYVKVNYLWADDAYKFRQLVLGLVVGINQGVDFMSMSTEELLPTALNLGAVEN